MTAIGRLTCLVLALVLLLTLGCAVNPVTGKQQLMLLSEQDEIRLGSQTDQSIIKQYGVYSDDRLQGYLQGIGQSMGRLSHRPRLNWQFKVMDSPVVNAFAAPGGYIYVTRGLLAAINSEAELAGVLGHEIGHVTARHSARQYSNLMLSNLGLSLGQGLLGGYNDLLGPLVQAGAGLLFLKFSRDDEREADALGVEYAARAGYDASRMADFFVTLQRQPSAAGDQTARLPEFFSTHPSPADREATVRVMAARWQSRLPDMKFADSRDPFLDRIDGLAYGEDPRHGFREGGWYYLPRFGVKLPIPEGWELEREGNNLQLKPSDRKAVTLVSIRPDTQSVDAVAAFLQATQARILEDRSVMNNGMPVRLLLSTIAEERQRTVIVSHFYQKSSDVFAFHGMASESDYASLKPLLQLSATGFQVMTDPARLHRQPRRIEVEPVTRATTLEGFLRSGQVDHEFWDRIAWLNGRPLSASLVVGERVKMIR